MMNAGGSTIGILQPMYLPWLGYFEQMAVVDRFVFLDDVQYTRQDWRNRNRIKTATGSIWLTVPVKKHRLGTRIRDIEINHEHHWQRRHLRSIEQNYGKCPFFQPLFGELESELDACPDRLAELDCRLIALLCRFLEIETETFLASELAESAGSGAAPGVQAREDPNQRLIDLCLRLGGSRFYEGARGADYIDVERFRQAGVEVVFQDYQHPTYPQPFGEFLPYQSAIDLVMNTGPEAPAILRSSSAVGDRWSGSGGSRLAGSPSVPGS